MTFKKRLRFLKAELIKLTNDETKNTASYLQFVDEEIQKIDKVSAPYNHDFTEDELQEIKDYLIKVKKIFEHQESEEVPGILSTVWDWLVSATPYIAFGGSVIAALFLGVSYLDNEEEPELKPIFGKKSQRVLKKCLEYVDKWGNVPIVWIGHTKDVGSGSEYNKVAYGSDDGIVYICDIVSDKLLQETEIDIGYGIVSMGSSLDKKYIASADEDSVLRVWDVISGEQVAYLGYYSTNMYQVSWGPQQKYLAASNEGILYLWGLSPSNHVPLRKPVKIWVNQPDSKRLSTTKTPFAWDSQGDYIVSVDKDHHHMVLWDVTKEKIISRVNIKKGDELKTLSWSHTKKGDYIISGSAGGVIKIWKFSPEEKKVQESPVAKMGDHASPICNVKLSPDQKYAVSVGSSRNESLKIWEVHTGKLLSTLQNQEGIACNSLSWSPDGKGILFQAKGGVINLWPLTYQ